MTTKARMNFVATCTPSTLTVPLPSAPGIGTTGFWP